MKKILLLSALLIFSYGFSQILTIAEGSSISIEPNSSITVDGLQITPSTAYTLTGPNAFERVSVLDVVKNHLFGGEARIALMDDGSGQAFNYVLAAVPF